MLQLLKRITFLTAVAALAVYLYRLILTAWSEPRTWAAGETITAAIMNTHVRDNLDALKDPPTDVVDINDTADYTTTSATFVDVDADLTSTITTAGGAVLVTFVGTVTHSTAAARIFFNIAVDNVTQVADDGIAVSQTADAADRTIISFSYWIEGLAAGAHSFELQWRTSTGTATMYAGAGTSNYDVHPQFVAREVS